jgi:uncharacterized repeat protein (TIGR01451 family)
LLGALVWGTALADQAGQRLSASTGIRESTSSIQLRQATSTRIEHPDHELEYPDKSSASENPDADAIAQYPKNPDAQAAAQHLNNRAVRPAQSTNIHTTAGAFDGATLTDTGAFPPDSMGTIGPAQFVTFVNGRIRSFTKAGVADGVLNADPNVFFASVMTPVTGSVVLTFTSDPQVRYDRFSARWFLTIIDVPCTNATCTTTAPNRLLMAVSDAASNGTLSGSTVWTFFQFQPDPGTNFCDYPSLGIDVNALYIGCNMFTNAGSFVGTNGYVVQKTSTLGAGPPLVTMFANLAAGAGAGPESPRGVDNYDATATEGYFVGPDNAAFSTIAFRRVSNPGAATPTISANIPVTVPTTTLSGTQAVRLVQHAGNTGGNNGLLDSLDDRFYSAMIRNGRLWSAHNFTVSATGVASTAAASRNAVRWYEFQNLTTTPTLVQSGTVFDNAATRAAARQYWIPSAIVTGQGHSILGMSMAGTPVGATPVYVGRLAGDTLGTMVGPPTVAAVTYGTTTANYNPPTDPGGTSGRRWGDYSFTSLDPLDDMTVWTIQEYNQASNSYAVRVGRLAAPPPATPTCSGSPITFAGPTGNVVINATSTAGSGFYDPGANLPAPALAFTHLSATVTNAVVNSVTYNSPTQATLNITALATGLQNVTVTNPDGQSVTANGCINVQSALAADLAITKTDGVTTAVPGGSVTYTITASNPSAVAAIGATVADTFPASLTCTWTCVGAGGGTCTASGSGNINDTVNLPAGASVTYTPTCAISAAATGTLSNTATVTLAGDPNAANNSATDTDTLTPQANLGITNTDGVTTATPGGSATYTITASNAGPSNAPGSLVADTFPASLTCTWTCVGAGGGTCTASGSGNINDTTNLPAGSSVTYTASCTISAAASGTLTNTATVAAPAGVTDPTPGNNSAPDIDTLAASADLSITNIDGVSAATPGGSVTYTITASNAGPSNAPGATVADTFPASLTCTWTCVGAGGGTCTASGSGNINDTTNLPAGGSITYTASCTISAAATGTLTNTATVAAPAGITDPTPGNNSATDIDTLAASADLSITNTDGVSAATPGGSVTYTITASNAGPSNATGATVADTFPAALTCTWTCVGAGGGTCTASGSGNINDTINLPAGGSVTYTASCTISAAATGTLTNTATVAAPAGVTDPTPGNNSATDIDTLVASADLAITNTDGVTTATPGGSVTYTITASNAGPSNATGATVADTFPASLTCTWTCVGAGGGTCTASGSGNINDTINLPAGGSTTYTASCTISAAATGTLTNTATVAAPAGVTDPTPGNNSAPDTDTLAASADLSITNTDGVTTAAPGGSVTYTITASNAGPSNAPGSTIADTFPASLTCTWTCVGAGGGTCTASGSGNINDTINLPAGGSTTYTASCTISAAATGLLNNTATVTAPGGVTDPTPGNNSATDTDTFTPQADLTLTKTHAGNFAQGQTGATYTLTASNAGSAPTSGTVTVTDTLPAGLTATAISGTGWSCTLGSLICTRSDALAAGSSYPPITLTVNVADNAALSVTNNATVSGGGEANTSNDSASDATTITQLPDLTITKTHSGNFSQGQTGATYTLTAGNAGSAPTSGTVTVTDTLPAGLIATAIGGTGWSCTLGSLICTRSDALAAGSSYPAITLTVNVANNAAASVTNNATVSGGGEANTSNDSASDATTITAVTYTIAGTVTGATSPAALTLSDTTHSTSQSLSSSGAFTFSTPLPIGSNWSVAVTTPPSGQSCTVANGSGTNLSANVTNVQVTCAAVLVTIAPATLTNGTFSLPYSQQLSASSSDSVDHSPYTFTLASGSVPAGLTLSAGGLLSGTPTAVGSFSFTVQAAGSGGAMGTQAYTLIVDKKTTTVTLAATPNPAVAGQTVTLTATVAGDPPTGTVSFSDNSATLPCSPVTLIPGATNSIATCTTTFTTTGTHSITASYSGDGDFVQATSSVLAVTVNATASPAVPAPTLDRWALLMLCALLGTAVFVRLRRV